MTADELIIHIGHRNTDAVVLQNTLTASRKALAENGIYYPKFATENREGFVLGYETQMVHEGAKPDTQIPPLRDHWDRLTSHNDILPNQKIIVSNRKYFKQIAAPNVAHFEAMTNQVARNKKIVAYLRAPDSYFLSLLQQRLVQNRDLVTPSRTRIKERIDPLSHGWSGAVSLTIFSETVLTDGNIVDDFFAHHVPDFDRQLLVRPRRPVQPVISAEAIALLIDRRHGRLDNSVDPDVLVKQIVNADARLAAATPAVLHPTAARTLRNWAAPDLVWLRDKYGIHFPDPGYKRVDADDVDLSIIHFTHAGQICAFDTDRKEALYEKALARARMPRLARKLLTLW
jgi:hypothetical protein